MKTLLTGTLMALLLATIVHAQAGLTGKWEGETQNGSHIVLDLTATKTKLTGTLARNGEPTTIDQGKVSKNTFTFKATLNEQTETFSGKFDGDQMKVWLDRQGPTRAAVLKRIKD